MHYHLKCSILIGRELQKSRALMVNSALQTRADYHLDIFKYAIIPLMNAIGLRLSQIYSKIKTSLSDCGQKGPPYTPPSLKTSPHLKTTTELKWTKVTSYVCIFRKCSMSWRLLKYTGRISWIKCTMESSI